MKYISIDVETSGVDWDTCQIIEFGAVYEDTSVPTPLGELQTFHRYVLPYDGKTIRGEPFALKMNAAIIAKISDFLSGKHNPEDQFVDASDLCQWFKRWIHSVHGSTKINIAGKNFSGFDLRFMEKLNGWESIQYRRRIIDPAMGFWNPAEHEEMPNLSECLRIAGCESTVTHRALDDAYDVVRTIRYIQEKRS